MQATLPQKGDGCAKAGRGRPLPLAIKLVEDLCESIAKDDNVARRIERRLDTVAHIERLADRARRELNDDLHKLHDDCLPALREAAGLAERLYLDGRA